MDDRILREKEFHNDRFSDETRESTWKYYAIERGSRGYFNGAIIEDVAGKKVLELGCGKGGKSIGLAEKGAKITGIDISNVAIATAQEIAGAHNFRDKAEFLVMNAEDLEFKENNFDIIFGASILHHLELKKVLPELARVLNSKGKATFIEPLGHNPFINLYRRKTPRLRTVDEHPLIRNDFEVFYKYFNDVKLKFFHLTTIMAVPFRKVKGFTFLLSILERIDSILLRVPVIKYLAWQVIIEVSKPKNSSYKI